MKTYVGYFLHYGNERLHKKAIPKYLYSGFIVQSYILLYEDSSFGEHPNDLIATIFPQIEFTNLSKHDFYRTLKRNIEHPIIYKYNTQIMDNLDDLYNRYDKYILNKRLTLELSVLNNTKKKVVKI